MYMLRNIGTAMQIENWLKLADLPRVGGAKIQKLMQSGNFSLLENASFSELQTLGLNKEQARNFLHPDNERLDVCMRWLEEEFHTILTFDDPLYPEVLQQISSPPPLLFIKGHPSVLSMPQVAIVGSRSATPSGKETTAQFAFELASQKIAITSGLALGVDGAAHKGALAAKGVTIGVLGTGIERIYPRQHRLLATQLQERGALISEFWPQQEARPDFFPRRNRIISGLALGVLIVECTEKSGSLITAHYALEQNRDVFAIPGSIHNRLAKGPHNLIKQGAQLVDDPIDIMHVIAGRIKTLLPNISKIEESVDILPNNKVLEGVGYEETPVDLVAKRCALPINKVLSELIELELQGLVIQTLGGYQRVR